MAEHIFSVSQIARYIKQIFDAEELLFNISILGEASGVRLVRDIMYFDLKDENALIPCVCFAGKAFSFLKNGDKVLVKGSPNYYVKGGRLSFNVSRITPYGIGDLYQQYLMLKDKLEKEGLFDSAHKKPLPNNVKRLGVISSETGAVIQDIITVTRRRNKAVDIVLYPAKVQGEGTVESIVKGLDFFENHNVDVVIIARGGGSMEDLAEFNSETLARRIYSFTKPVISAVGHETDFTICDFVADVRGATPSVGAELAVQRVSTQKELFARQCGRIKSLLDYVLSKNRSRLKTNVSDIKNYITTYTNELKYMLALKRARLEKTNPNEILKLGYARVEQDGKPLTHAQNLNENMPFEIIFQDGKIKGEKTK